MTTLNNYWISWFWLSAFGEFELHSPWWVTGERLGDGAQTICAGIQAESDSHAREMIYAAYDKRPKKIEWRFCDQQPHSWEPFSERFQRAEWMKWASRATV